MHMLMRAVLPVETANKAVPDGTLGAICEKVFSAIHPEAVYFLAHQGKRCCMVFFDLKSPSDIPSIAEPFFLGLNAEIEFIPVMNTEELMKGLAGHQANS